MLYSLLHGIEYNTKALSLHVKHKDFQGNQKDVGMVEANKVSKQEKNYKGSYHCPVCHKQGKLPCTVPHNHPYTSSWKPLIASNCNYFCRDGYVERCLVLCFVCGTRGSGSYLYSLCLLTLLPLPSWREHFSHLSALIGSGCTCTWRLAT